MKYKHLSLLLLGCIICANTFSQPTIIKQKAIGGNGPDDLSMISLTKDGGLIGGGTSESNKSGDKTQNGRGYQDYWVVKLDKASNIQWDKTIGGNMEDFFSAVQQTDDGGYIL